MRAHEAGALHGQGAPPAWLPFPTDVNDLLQVLWPRTVAKDADGVLHAGGMDVREIAAQVGTPAYVLDEEDFRHRARAFRTAFADAFAAHGGARVYYAAKAFISIALAQWIAEEGLSIEVCTGGELAVVLRAGVDPAEIEMHGNNKSEAEIERALRVGVGRIVLDSLSEIELVARVAQRLGVRAPVLLRITLGVEAHTHEFIATAHEDQKFGLSLADGTAMAAVRATLAQPALDLLGLHSHIGSQIFDTAGFEVAGRRLLRLYRQVQAECGRTLPEINLGGGYGVAYTSGQDPIEPAALAGQLATLIERECAQAQIAVPAISIETGRAIAGPAAFTLYRVGVVKNITLDGGLSRQYVAVDGGMSDNIRTALYDADYSATLASRYSRAEPVLSRVVGKHCESGDIVVKDEYLPADIAPGDLLAVPVTGAYCRALSSNYNHVPRPPVVAVKDGQLRTLLRRETEADLLALDEG